TSYLDYNVLDYPNITITDLSYPAEVLFNKGYSVSFMLNKSSSSIPKNIEISLLQNSFSEKWDLEELDNNKKEYETIKDFSIIVTKLSFPQKVLSLLYSLELWLGSFF
ncbi:MAG: hypothetical protein KKF74_00060, partial [Nanoarchaeota archaeon]|nr:hypothetical protein [Nanoarchaeota archaeon]